MNIIGCIDTPTSGKISIAGVDVSRLSDRELTKIRLKKIGFIFQLFYLIPTLTAQENIELPMREAKIGSHQRKQRAEQLLRMVGLSTRGHHYPNQLSGGEQQRIAIARALAHKPSIIYADEPTGNLDTYIGKEIIQLFKRLARKEKITIKIVADAPKLWRRSAEIVLL